MVGYDPMFLGVDVPLPTFRPNLAGDIVRSETLRDGVVADYLHYSVVTNRVMRSPVFAALNIDQDKLKSVDRTDDWEIDTRIGADYQLNNDYYERNPWDRGHIARRASAAWGDDRTAARKASDATFYYSNAALQHKNFNRDEWVALEDWVKDLTLDDTNKVTEISGPIYGRFVRSIRPAGRATALVPSAFFKVVCFINRKGDLDVRAFIMAQDQASLADQRGRRMFDNQRYQVSIAEIEKRTGIDFPDVIPDRNPLLFNTSPDATDRLGVRHFPERVEVDSPEDMRASDERRVVVMDDDVDVFIAAALPNPKGSEADGEWISIINLGTEPVSLDGWTLSDSKRTAKELKGDLGPGEARRIQPVSPLRLSNEGGVILLFDAEGQRIDRVKYTRREAREGVPVVFARRDDLITTTPLAPDPMPD